MTFVFLFFPVTPTNASAHSYFLHQVAAIIALLNEQRLAADLPPMGFLNPFLYSIFESHPEAFNDVTVGNNVGRVSEIVAQATYHTLL